MTRLITQSKNEAVRIPRLSGDKCPIKKMATDPLIPSSDRDIVGTMVKVKKHMVIKTMPWIIGMEIPVACSKT